MIESVFDYFRSIGPYLTQINVISALLVGAIAINMITAVRALSLSQALQSGCVWVCRTVGNGCVIKMCQGMSMLCFMIALLKGWNLFQLHHNSWETTHSLHSMRAVAYLAVDYGIAMLGYAGLSVFTNMTKCTTADKYSKLQKEIKTNGCK